MGKNGVMHTLQTVLGRIAIHKILLKKGNRLEAKKHLQDEIRDYSANIFELANSYTWTKSEIEMIMQKAVKDTRNFTKAYPDVEITQANIQEAVVDTMQELMMIK